MQNKEVSQRRGKVFPPPVNNNVIDTVTVYVPDFNMNRNNAVRGSKKVPVTLARVKFLEKS
jgi:hypothetical protein